MEDYGIEGAKLTLLRNWQNTTFRVDTRSPAKPPRLSEAFTPGRFLIRLSRPEERTPSQIDGELAWLSALQEDHRVTVPKPLLTLDGSSSVIVRNTDHPGLDGAIDATRMAAVLHWMPGRMARAKSRRLSHMQLVGQTVARLHDHAEGWRAGMDLDRWSWDIATIMGHNTTIGIEPDIWDELAAEEHDLFSSCEAQLQTAIKALGHDRSVHGIIHADLHFANVLFAGGEARPIDFDDCGHGHYLYDMASPLMGFDRNPGEATWRDAFLTGYRSIRAISDDHLMLLNTFIAAREATLLLWCKSSARTRENFREALPGWNARAIPEIRYRLNAACAPG